MERCRLVPSASWIYNHKSKLGNMFHILCNALEHYSIMQNAWYFVSNCISIGHNIGGLLLCFMALYSENSWLVGQLVGWLVSWLVLWAQSTTKDYSQAEHKLHSISKLFVSQVTFFEPIYTPWALNTGTCIQQGDLFYSAGVHRNWC